ncbi:MAG TPA: alpha/beta hydrolase-fold protein [Flavitalea sp.]|nr:alpha/beta hydrolase-fold protein [Flavitalea sp.]
MTKRNRQFSVTLVMVVFLAAHALEITGQTSPVAVINQKEQRVLKSGINGVTYQLYISLPKHYSPEDTIRYPVLYLLDGGMGFPVAHAARTAMDVHDGLEDLIIVGIEYEWKRSLAPWFTNRSRDFTPTKNSDFEKRAFYSRTFGLPEGSLLSGGGPEFLNVIRKEIIPFIDKAYKTTGERGISGHSLGGLFAGYCLFSATDIFSRFGINSPSFWWDNREMFKIEKMFSERRRDLPAEVFLSVGGLEDSLMLPVITAFADTLASRKYRGLTLSRHIFEGETHMSVIPAMISRTLRVLYGAKKE